MGPYRPRAMPLNCEGVLSDVLTFGPGFPEAIPQFGKMVHHDGTRPVDDAEYDDEQCPGDLGFGKEFGDGADIFHLVFQRVTSAARRLVSPTDSRCTPLTVTWFQRMSSYGTEP